MDLLSKTEFLIFTICFDFLRKQLHTIYALGQRIRIIVYACQKQESTIYLLYYRTMCWGHLTQLCHILPGPWFRIGKWPQKHPAEFYYPTKLKGNLYSSCQKESNSPCPSISCYLVSGVYLSQLVPESQHLDSHRTHKHYLQLL